MVKAGRPVHADDLAPALAWEARIWWLFTQVQTQWRVAGAGMGGAIYVGLDYSPVIVLVRERRWRVSLALALIQAVELPAMAAMNSRGAN